MATEWPRPKRKPFFRTGAFYGGLAIGIFLFPFVFFAMAALASLHVNQPVKPVTSGNFTISMDDDLLTVTARLAMKKALTQLPQLPFAVTNVQAKTKVGDEIDVSANLGPINVLVATGPVVTSDGKIDFKITHTDVGGLFSLDAFNGAFEAALNDQFADVASGNVIKGLDYQLIGVSTTDQALVLAAKLFVPGSQ